MNSTLSAIIAMLASTKQAAGLTLLQDEAYAISLMNSLCNESEILYPS